ncbi:MAG: 30S ribosomal protein S5 [Spirochaetes bacterium GWF1_51_8]|nr:MAG: 30S ribosomal protein S5 [Spirochaetes bacterium GWF1_51_8]
MAENKGSRDRFKDRKKEKVDSEWEERVVKLRRVAKVTRGGKRFRFNAIIVVGNGKGLVGVGYGKANELMDAIRKAKDKAIKDAKLILSKRNTIPHEIVGRFKSGEVWMSPASAGTGVIAGGAVRPVLEMVGIKDVLTKSLRSTNAFNLVKATMQGLQNLMDVKKIAEKRGKSVQEVFGMSAKAE